MEEICIRSRVGGFQLSAVLEPKVQSGVSRRLEQLTNIAPHLFLRKCELMTHNFGAGKLGRMIFWKVEYMTVHLVSESNQLAPLLW